MKPTAIPSTWSRPWLVIEAVIAACAALFEAYAVWKEYGRRDMRYPTISRTLVALFKLKPLQAITIVLGFVLAFHWGTIKAALKRLGRKM